MIEFDKSPIDDIKKFTGRCAVGLIEGGCCNSENVHVLQDFRKHCDVLVSIGDCATHGRHPRPAQQYPPAGVPRRGLPQRPLGLQRGGQGARRPGGPLLLEKVYPAHEVVKIDYHLPGCPPPADTLFAALVALLSAKPLDLPYQLIKYD